MNYATFGQIFNQLSFDLPAFFAVILLHEYSHIVTARKLLGKDETENLRFSPFSHLDLFGSLLPICLVISGFPFIFGWGKRVEVSFDSAAGSRCSIVFGFAGMVGNMFLCLISGLMINAIPAVDFLFRFAGTTAGVFLYTMLFRFFSISLSLFLVNFLPIPPFDGGYLLFSLLPERFKKWQEKLQLLGLLIVVTLVVTGAAAKIFIIPYKMLTEMLCGGFAAYVLQPGSLAVDFLQR